MKDPKLIDGHARLQTGAKSLPGRVGSSGLKVLVLNYEFPPLGGGSSPVTYEIGQRYVERGHEVDVVTMAFRDLPLEETVSGMTVLRVPCLRSRVEMTRIDEMISYVISARRFLSRRLAHKSYDVSHTHFMLPTGLIASSIKRRYGLPYIVSAHGSDVPGYNPDRFRIAHKFTAPFLKRVGGDAQKITVMSDYLARLIRQRVENYSEEKLIHIPNGVDSGWFQPGPKQRVILATGRLLPRKGFQHLIHALSDKDCGYELHICGDGPMLDELRERARASKTRVVFHGWMDNRSQDYRDVLAAASIFVLASERENSSVALLEALSAGCAVVTAGSTGCKETVGDAGLLVRASNSGDLHEAIYALIRDDETRHCLQHSAVERARSTFDWDRIVDRYEEQLWSAALQARNVNSGVSEKRKVPIGESRG